MLNRFHIALCLRKKDIGWDEENVSGSHVGLRSLTFYSNLKWSAYPFGAGVTIPIHRDQSKWLKTMTTVEKMGITEAKQSTANVWNMCSLSKAINFNGNWTITAYETHRFNKLPDCNQHLFQILIVIRVTLASDSAKNNSYRGNNNGRFVEPFRLVIVIIRNHHGHDEHRFSQLKLLARSSKNTKISSMFLQRRDFWRSFSGVVFSLSLDYSIYLGMSWTKIGCTDLHAARRQRGASHWRQREGEKAQWPVRLKVFTRQITLSRPLAPKQDEAPFESCTLNVIFMCDEVSIYLSISN